MVSAAHPQRRRDGARVRARMRAGWISLAAGITIFGGKLSAYWITQSAAVFSDAMESTVNIAAAALLVVSLRVAARPADRDHPYGHGKVEFFSAGIEGTLILVAAILILVEAARDLWLGPSLRRLGLGLGVLAGFGALNAALGLYLVRVGRSSRSMALVADGKHILTDVWTSAGVIGGLVLARATGWLVLDPVVAIVVALNILREGFGLARTAVQGLMDAADEGILERIAQALEKHREDAWIDVHSLRAWRSGDVLHVDFHVSVPRYFDVERLHRIHDRLEVVVREATGHPGDVIVHFDPCRPRECPSCAMEPCPVRESPFVARAPFGLESTTREDVPLIGGPQRQHP